MSALFKNVVFLFLRSTNKLKNQEKMGYSTVILGEVINSKGESCNGTMIYGGIILKILNQRSKRIKISIRLPIPEFNKIKDQTLMVGDNLTRRIRLELIKFRNEHLLKL